MASLDYGVLNALNLINKNLGEAYETRGFNPFVDNFVLDKRLAEKLVAMKEEKRAVPPPEFLERGQEEILRRIKNAKRRLLNIILALEKACKNEVNFEVLEVISYAQIADELLKHINLKNLSYEELLDLFQTISVLNPEYGKILTKIFDKKFSVQLAVQAFMEMCNHQEVVEGKFKLDDKPKTPLKTQKKSLNRPAEKTHESQKEEQFTF